MSAFFRKVRHRMLSRRARSAPPLAELARECVVLCPAEVAETPPALFDEAALGRVTACEKTSTFAEELARLRGGPRRHGATTLYRLEDVDLRNGWLSCAGRPLQRVTVRDAAGPRRVVEMSRAAYAGTYVGSLYFGHWLCDDLPLLLEAAGHAPAVVAAHLPYSHEAGYLELAGIAPQPHARAHFDTLLWIDNVAQNSRRATQYRDLRRRIAGHTTPVAERRVMLHRGQSGVSRLLVNEQALEDLLAARGYEILDSGGLSAMEIAQACAGARIALGVEGSQLAHAFLAMAERAAIVAMTPPYRYINHYKDLTDCIGTMRYASALGTAAPGGFHVDPDELLRLLDRVEAALDAA